MSHSESESDSFLSADEFESDNEEDVTIKNTLNFKNNNIASDNNDTLLSVPSEAKIIATNSSKSNFSGHETIEEKTSTSTRQEEQTNIEDDCAVRSYRKRPERLKNTIDKVQKPKAIDFIPNIDIAKVTRTDVFTDLTHQFTSKISKGLATFQEKSSSLKGFVKENLVTDVNKFEESKFVYDDDRTQELKDEVGPPIQDVPKSSINDEILKLSNAFAKLNEKREESIEHSQQPNLNDERISCKNDKINHTKSKETVENSDSFDILADKLCVPSLFDSTVASHHQETSAGWDECIEDLLSGIANDAVPIPTQNEKAMRKLCQDTQDNSVTAADVHGDGWGDILDCDDEPIEENEPRDQLNQDSFQTENLDDLIDKEGALEKEISLQQSIQEKLESKDKDLDGWDDWEIESDNEEVHDDSVREKTGSLQPEAITLNVSHSKIDASSDEQDGWDDWGDDDFAEIQIKEEPLKQNSPGPRPLGSQDMKSSNVSKAKEWSGWDSFGQKKENDWNLGGWGINTLLNTATAVTSNLSAAIESGLGVPDPETMARIAVEEEKMSKDKKVIAKEDRASEVVSGQFPFQHIVAGVGKIVEVAKVQEIGSRVLSGGLDTLESIGKKTMEVLQEGDPGLKKKRALIAEQGEMLSKVLKEARDRAMEEDRHSKEMKIERRCHFETLFDDFQGLVHLEALEMLSRQCELRLEQIQQSLPSDRKKELQETLEEVKELCEVDEEFDIVEVDNFEEAISEVVAPLKNELSVNKIIEVHKRLSDWLVSENIIQAEANQLYDEAISTMAELTAAITMQFHKSGELLILKERRKTVEEADCLMQLSSHLCYEVKTITNSLEDQLSKKTNGDISNLIISLQSECDNAVGYIKQAFKLLIPVIQLGAA